MKVGESAEVNLEGRGNFKYPPDLVDRSKMIAQRHKKNRQIMFQHV